jgi:hypothetical protein
LVLRSRRTAAAKLSGEPRRDCSCWCRIEQGDELRRARSSPAVFAIGERPAAASLSIARPLEAEEPVMLTSGIRQCFFDVDLVRVLAVLLLQQRTEEPSGGR